jgi:hypothetical protein
MNAPRTACLLVALLGCARPAATHAPAAEPVPTEPTKAIAEGDRMTPLTTPTAIPVKGAKLTMVNYFATWCMNSSRWIPAVEAMQKKYADAGLAVIGVPNTDEATPAELEAFVKANGGSFQVVPDPDRRILYTLMPRGWGQQIVVVDAKGVVRLVHRGTNDGDFEKVDAAIGRLLAPAR